MPLSDLIVEREQRVGVRKIKCVREGKEEQEEERNRDIVDVNIERH